MALGTRASTTSAGTKHDGVKPIDNVILLNGALYGMTTEGGDFDQGTIFQIPLN
jgi:uncharacterized repeat protein (TIGR03803 family)